MKMEAMVVGERENSYESKRRGAVTERVCMLQDQDERKPFINTVDFVLSDEDSKKYPKELLRGQRVVIHFDQMRVDFGGRFKLQGELVPLNPAMTKPNK
jgi:hypothetical protein